MRRTRLPLREWLFATLLGLVAVAVRASAQPLLGDQQPFLVAFPAVVIASLLWGTGAGVITALWCALGAAIPAIPPNVPLADLPMQIGAFLAAAALVSLLCGQAIRARAGESTAAAAGVADTPLITWLRAVLWSAIVIPTTAFVFIAWWGFERAEREATASATHASDLAYRHAQRTFSIAADIAARADRSANASDEVARANEAAIHQRLGDLVAGLPSVVNLNVWDADGRPIARSDVYPVSAQASVADREYFREQRAGNVPLGISEVIRGRQTGLELMNVTIRRASPDGEFRGVVAVSLSPGYFREYYEALASEDPRLASFALVRTDGALIARWPQPTDGRTATAPDSPVFQRIKAGDRSGTLMLPERPDREARLASFRRIDDYPLYVVAGLSRDAMFATWARFVALLAAVLVPVTIGLVCVSWLALKKTRREQATTIELQEQMRRRAAAEKSMLETQKLETLAVVTGGIAHDFNNLLAIVNASLHVHKRLHPAIAEEKQVQAMGRAIRSGVRLTRQLLSFSRKQALRPEEIDLASWLPATESLIRSTLGPTITWQLGVAPDVRPVVADEGELELALINLVVNARHAMPEGGQLTLHAGNAPGGGSDGRPRVEIAVSDNGSGIAPELLPKVFEPFFTTRERGAGSGLGLSQVQGFCEQAGGSVHIDSVVGQGTTVSMILPAAAAAAVNRPMETPPETGRLHGRVLLVEDDADVAGTTAMLLRTAGLEVEHVASADAALDWLASSARQPDVVLSDVAMPGSMNGIALAFELRKRRPGLPVLLTTGYAEQVSEAAAGGFRVLPKPTSPEQTLAELQAVLPRRTLQATRESGRVRT